MVENWYTPGQWADVSYVLESGCCFLFILLFLHYSFSPIFNIEIFVTLFSGTLRPRGLKIGTRLDSGQMCVPESGCCFLFIPLLLHVSFSPIFNIDMFHHSFLRNCKA